MWEEIVGPAPYEETDPWAISLVSRITAKGLEKGVPGEGWNHGPFSEEGKGESKMQSTAFCNLLTEKPLKKSPSFEKELSREIASSDTLDQRAGRSVALSSLEQGVATLLDDAGSLNIAGTIFHAGPAKETARKNFFKTLG